MGPSAGQPSASSAATTSGAGASSPLTPAPAIARVNHATILRRRAFLKGLDVTDAEQLRAVCRTLGERDISSLPALTEFMRDFDGVRAAVLHRQYVLKYAAGRNTEDADVKAQSKHFHSVIVPLATNLFKELNAKLLSSPFLQKDDISSDQPALTEFRELVRVARFEARNYSSLNPPLEARDAELRATYGQTTGAMELSVAGSSEPITQLPKHLVKTNRAVREEAWRSATASRLAAASGLDGVFEEMVALRHQIAGNVGLGSYAEYKAVALRRDYSLQDCKDFHEAIAAEVVPVLAALRERRRQQMGLATLRPWDLDVDPLGREPLVPYATPDEYVGRTIAALRHVSPSVAEELQNLRDRGDLDLMGRPGKIHGGFNLAPPESGLTYIFNNATGTHTDVRVLTHEMGHAFHARKAFGQQTLMANADMEERLEPAEFAALTMELLSMDGYGEFYTADEVARARELMMEMVLGTFMRSATLDAFQLWAYENPNHSPSERNQKWAEIFQRFEPGIDWSGLEPELGYGWQAYQHIYRNPMYIIEYAIARLGSLQVWSNYRSDSGKAFARFEGALALGASVSNAEIFEAAGARLDFSRSAVHEAMELVRKELGLAA